MLPTTQLIRHGRLNSLTIRLSSLGVRAGLDLQACRDYLRFCKTTIDDDIQVVDEPVLHRVDRVLHFLRQHFEPLGLWQGFQGDMGFGNPLGGRADGVGGAEGVGEPGGGAPPANGGGPPGRGGAGGLPQVPAGVGAAIVVANQRVLPVGVNPLDTFQKREAELLFPGHVVLTGYHYRAGVPGVVYTGAAEAFAQCIESVANSLLKSGDLVAVIQLSVVWEDFGPEVLPGRGLLVYKVTLGSASMTFEYVDVLGSIPDWTGLMPLVNRCECPAGSFGAPHGVVLRMKEGAVREELLGKYRVRCKEASVPTNGKSVCTVDDEHISIRKMTDMSLMKYVLLNVRTTDKKLLRLYGPSEVTLYQDHEEDFGTLIRQLEVQRKGTVNGPSLLSPEHVGAYSRVCKYAVLKSSLAYTTLLRDFKFPPVRSFMTAGGWNKHTVMEDGRPAFVYAMQRYNDFLVVVRGEGWLGVFARIIEILSTTQGPVTCISYRHWNLEYIASLIDVCMNQAGFGLATWTPDTI